MSKAEITQKAPYAVDVSAGKKYFWCACGLSESQPFCDGSHKDTGFSPVRFDAAVLQRALQIPIGIISNARGGASIESLVPLHKFDDHPVAAAYKAHLDKLIADCSLGDLLDRDNRAWCCPDV